MTKGWKNESHRHSLSAKGIKTGRKMKASGFADDIQRKKYEERSTDFLVSKSRWLYKTILGLKSETDVWSKQSVVGYIKNLNMVNEILDERNVEVDYSDIENGE